MKIAISFDYDSPVGYRESFSKASLYPAADVEGTDAILRVLTKHDVVTSFAVVGHAALEGPSPEHAPDQVRTIADAGHEVCSHSMMHRFIPPMRTEELMQDLRQSKQALETCTGQLVQGFVPPFNRPFHFPAKGAISLSEMIGLHGRGRGRQNIDSLLGALHTCGFSWARVSFQPTLHTLAEKLGHRRTAFPWQPFLWRGVVAIPLHYTGFGATAIELCRRYMHTDMVITLCGHPFQALDSTRVENNEHVDCLDNLLATFEPERASGKLQFCTMRDAEASLRSPDAEIVPAFSKFREVR